MGIDADALTWRYAGRDQATRGVALVIHGLNLHPAKMTPIVDLLTRSGIDVLLLALRGHGPNYAARPERTEAEARLASFRRVSYPLWQDEVRAAYVRVAARSRELGGVPCFLVAFSLGAVMGCDAALATPDIRFDRMVLLAPALAIHWYSYVFRLLAPLPRLVIPSLMPPSYRANRGTSIAAYSALYTAIGRFRRRLQTGALDLPVLVLIDEQDEMVSYQGIKQLVAQAQLSRWRLQPVVKADDAQERYHHLLIDPPSVGAATWQEMTAHIRAHLLPDRPD